MNGSIKGTRSASAIGEVTPERVEMMRPVREAATPTNDNYGDYEQMVFERAVQRELSGDII